MATASTTDAEIILALRAVRDKGSNRAAGRFLGINSSTVDKRVQMATARGLTADSAIVTDEDKLRAEVKRLKADVQRLAQENDTEARILEEAFKFAARVPEPARWADVRPFKRGVTKEVPVLFASDWHWAEVVDPVEVAGVNAFNSGIARQRAELFFDTAINLTLRDGGAPGIVLCLGGDLITGTIHEELAETNDRTTVQAVHELTDVLIAGIDKLVAEFKRIFIPGVVGNHGRNTMRPRFKQKAYTSYEWLMYQTLARHYRHNPAVTFFIPGEADAFFKVNGKRILLTHGDTLGVKGGDGIIGAIGPIMRGTVKLGTSEAQLGRDFDYLMMGHWHYPLYLPRTIVNGALKGYDEYARLALRVPYAPASQLLFRVHPEHGLTSRREIILQEPLAAVNEENWVSWPKIA